MEPGHADARADFEAMRVDAVLFHHADHLMARNHRRFEHRQFAFDHVQIGAADAAGVDLDQHFAGPRLGRGNVGVDQRIGLNRGTRGQNASFHADS